VDPDASLGDLIGRLTDDGKRLLSDEVRLAKLESSEAAHSAARGSVWLGVAFGVATVAMVALTIFAIAAIGAGIRGHYWAGALIIGALEVALGAWLLTRGVHAFKRGSYTLGETRKELSATTKWIAAARAD
jgi:uncharacterized membrane protein YqjE